MILASEVQSSIQSQVNFDWECRPYQQAIRCLSFTTWTYNCKCCFSKGSTRIGPCFGPRITSFGPPGACFGCVCSKILKQDSNQTSTPSEFHSAQGWVSCRPCFRFLCHPDWLVLEVDNRCFPMDIDLIYRPPNRWKSHLPNRLLDLKRGPKVDPK